MSHLDGNLRGKGVEYAHGGPAHAQESGKDAQDLLQGFGQIQGGVQGFGDLIQAIYFARIKGLIEFLGWDDGVFHEGASLVPLTTFL
jgi:hypothetical protein